MDGACARSYILHTYMNAQEAKTTHTTHRDSGVEEYLFANGQVRPLICLFYVFVLRLSL